MELEFNQKLLLPPFLIDGHEKKRNLLAMDTIDVNRDIISFKMHPQSEIASKNLKYSIEVQEWTEYNLKI